MRRLALALFLASAFACAPKTVEPWDGPTAASGPTETVAMPSLGLKVDVPTGTDVVHVGSGATFYVSPGTRAARSFSIEDGQPALVHTEPAESRQEKTLRGGGLIRYEIRRSEAGSGGTEAFLTGALVVDQHLLAVHCHDQAEPPAEPAAEWCLTWLATVRKAE